MLSDVFITFNILYQHIVHVDWRVVYRVNRLQPSLLSLRYSSSDPFAYFHRISLVAYVVIIGMVMFLCIGIIYVISKANIVEKIPVYLHILVLPGEPSK